MNCTGKRCIMQYGEVDPATCEAVTYCPQATPPKTNADKIRAMTDEELAKTITGDWCEIVCNETGLFCGGTCEQHILKWLKEEAER